MRPPSDYKFKSMMWRSHDGRDWTSAEEFGDHDFWLWRVQFHRGRGYSMGYAINEPRSLRSYLSMDGYRFDVLGNNVFDKNYQLAADYSTGGAQVFAAVRWQP